MTHAEDDRLPELPPALTDSLFAALYGDPEQRAGVFARLLADHPEHAAALRVHFDRYLELQRGGPQQGPATEPTIPGYLPLQVLGEGGMGTVYRARQLGELQRFVALKVIKHGMEGGRVLARFEHERQALAAMDHDTIARIFDCGTTAAGQPYFAMELVEGLPLHQYCDLHRLGLRERIELFLQVCQGVQHAHQKGVIHRDLKPGNVLVAEQEGRHAVKIIDFGVARAMDQSAPGETSGTELGTIVGTREYMSPEQAAGDVRRVDTRSDVYSLGVMLYELLVGDLPFPSAELRAAAVSEVQRRLREDEPPKPSTRLSSMGRSATECADLRRISTETLRRELQRDLDWVVLKAMAKEPDRRYESPAALADDLRRYLAHEPLVAGPPSAMYRLRKLVRRHRVQVAAGAIVLLSLAGGGGGVWVQYVRAEERAQENAELARTNGELARKNGELASAEAAAKEQAQRNAEAAQKRARELEQVLSFHESQWEKADAESMGAHLRRTLLAAAPAEQKVTLEAGLAGLNFTNIARDSLRENLFDPSLTAIDAGFGDQPVVKARLLHSIGATLYDLGMLEPARAAEAERLTILQSLGDDEEATAAAKSFLGRVLAELGRADEAEPLLEQAVAVYRGKRGEEDRETLLVRLNLAEFLKLAGRYEEADRLLAELVPCFRRTFGNDDPQTLVAVATWGGVKVRVTDYGAAKVLLQEVLEGRRRSLGEDALDTLLSKGDMGSLELYRGDFDAAEKLLGEALDGYRRRYGDDNPRTLQMMHNNVSVLHDRGRHAEARDLCRTVLEARRRLLGPDHRETLLSLRTLGIMEDTLGNYGEGEALLRQALDRCQKALGEEDTDTQRALNHLAVCLKIQGKLPEATRLQRQAADLAVRLHTIDSESALIARRDLADLLIWSGELDEAEDLLRDVLERSRGVLGQAHDNTFKATQSLVDLLLSRGGAAHLREAEMLQRDCLQRMSSQKGAADLEVLVTTGRLASVLEAMGRYDDALLLRQSIVETMGGTLGPTHHAMLTEQNNLGVLLHRMGKLAEASQALAAVHVGQRSQFGEDNEVTQNAAINLASVYAQQERYAEAEPLLRAAVSWLTEHRGVTDPGAITAVSHLAILLERTKRLPEAEALHRSALDGCRAKLGPDAVMTLIVTRNLGHVLTLLERYDEAIRLLGSAEAASRSAFVGGNVLYHVYFLSDLGKAYIGRGQQGDHVAAERVLREAYDLAGAGTGGGTAMQQSIARGLVALYEAWDAAEPDKGRGEQAKEWKAKR